MPHINMAWKIPKPWPLSGKVWINPTKKAPQSYDLVTARNIVYRHLDRRGFDWQVWAVCAFGFFTDSYALFATNVILPYLAFVYWPQTTNNKPEYAINCVTLAGSACGQLVFGIVADKLGRRRFYGLELAVVVFATLGMAEASTGMNHSMDIMGWIIFWRFCIGVGIGAEYPLTAVITFADHKSRARMLAAVFFMQPIGQFAATAVGWGALASIFPSQHLDTSPADGELLSDTQKYDIISAIDTIWRCVIGPGAALALIAIFYRISIPESPRYTLDVDGDGRQAVSDINEYDPDPVAPVLPLSTEAPVSSVSETTPSVQIPTRTEPKLNGSQMISSPARKEDQVDQIIQLPSKTAENTGTDAPLHTTLGAIEKPTEQPAVARPTPTSFWKFLWVDGNIRYLSATSICWFLLDFAFYGLGINNPRVIAAIWRPTSQIANSNWPGKQTSTPYDNISNVTLPDFENPYDPGTNIYQELFDNARQYLITVSIGSMLGSIFLLFFINYWSRRRFLIASFIILSGLFLATAFILRFLEFESAHFVIIIFYMLCQFFFNFGPNSLTFIIPAEIFPTEYRCTCYGISAAFGKLGSILVQITLSQTSEFSHHPKYIAWLLTGFSPMMFLGAIIAWAWLPEVQTKLTAVERDETEGHPKFVSKTLEELAVGWRVALQRGEVLEVRERFKKLFRITQETHTNIPPSENRPNVTG